LTDEFVTELDEIFVAENSAVVAHHATAMRGERRLEMNYLIRLEIHDGRVTQAVSVPVDQRENDDFWGESAPYVN
jgi:ketosteroid isomerase-like protein